LHRRREETGGYRRYAKASPCGKHRSLAAQFFLAHAEYSHRAKIMPFWINL
jgi:hypothetical protein